MDGGSRQLALADLLDTGDADGSVRVVHTDERFERTVRTVTLAEGWRCEILRDRLTPPGGLALELVTIALEPPPANAPASAPSPPPSMCLDGATALRDLAHDGDVATGPGLLLWLPVPPADRRWDASRRHILAEAPRPARLEPGGAGLVLDLGGAPVADRLEIQIVRAEGEAAAALEHQLATRDPVETRRWSFVRHFDYGGLGDVWHCLAAGAVHEQRAWHAGGRSRNEQAGRVLDQLLGILGAATGKALYATLQEAVAYAVLLALDDDHRWRHGNWTDLDETHTRLQLDGIALLLAQHARSGTALFRARALEALDWLLRIAAPLDTDGLWFLHDTLEIDLATARRFYAMSGSTAFGKPPGVTLCLNTQLDTLAALARLGATDPGSPHHDAFTRGLRAAERVLTARPGERWFAILAGLRDRALHAQRPGADGRPRDGGVWGWIERGTRALLRRSKSRWPRLVLPNGFIERDLTAAAFSDFYHVQNVKDLQVLERLVGAAWMRPLIEAGVAWLVERDPAQLVVRHRGATSLLAVLGMELAHADGAPDPRLRAGLELAARRLAAAGIGLPVDLVTCTMGSAAHAALGALDPRLVPVGLPDGGLLVLNPAMVAVEGVPPGGSQLRPGGLARPGVRP